MKSRNLVIGMFVAAIVSGVAMAQPEDLTRTAELKPSLDLNDRTDTWDFKLAPTQTATYNVNIEYEGNVGGILYRLDEPLKPPTFDPTHHDPDFLWAWRQTEGLETSRSRQFKVVNTVWEEKTASVKVTCTWKPVRSGLFGGILGAAARAEDLHGWAEGIAKHQWGQIVPTSDITIQGAPSYLCINKTIILRSWLVTNDFQFVNPMSIVTDWEDEPIGENGGGGHFVPTTGHEVLFSPTNTGPVRVTATHTEHQQHSGTVEFTIVEVKIEPETEPGNLICVGNTKKYTAVVTPTNVQGTFAWSVSDTNKLDIVGANNQQTVTVTGKVASTAMNSEELKVEFSIDGELICEPSTNLTVIQLNLDGLRVYDPKLETADSANIEYKIEAPADAGFSPRVELTIMDGTYEVACLVRKTEPAPALNVEITKIWDGRWGIEKDGTDSAHIGKFADPKRYTVELKVYESSAADAVVLCAKEYDLYVVRLGILEIGFKDDQELTYHKTTKDDLGNFTFTDNTAFAQDVVWKIEHLDFVDPDVGLDSRTSARVEQTPTGECYTDTDNERGRTGAELYYDAFGTGSYSPDERQVNFPPQIPTANPNQSGGFATDRFNRPAVYVQGNQIKVWFKPGNNAKSDITTNNCAVGYPTTDYPIRVKGRFRGGAMGPTTNAIIPTGGPYEMTSTATLPGTVGHDVEEIQFLFQYSNSVSEAWEDIPGHQKTTHLIYRLAAAPTDFAKQQGGGRLFMKIVDFTCDWADGKTTPEEVFNEIWDGSNFWTPIIPGANPRPDNINGFVGRGDPIEADREDKWNNRPMAFTYDHDPWVEENVQYALDNNVIRCGGWAKFLSAFAGYHGKEIIPIQVYPLWIRERGGVESMQPWDGDGWAVGDTVWGHDIFGIDPGMIGLIVAAIDGQANPYGGGHLGNIFNVHRIAYHGTGPTLRIYDPSYDHQAGVAGGRAQEGWQSYHAYNQDAFIEYYYPMRATVSTVDGNGRIIAVNMPYDVDVVRPNDPNLTEIETKQWP